MAGDRVGQPAYEIFSLKLVYSLKTQYYSIACCTRLPRWQDRCYRALRELWSIYLFYKRTSFLIAVFKTKKLKCTFCVVLDVGASVRCCLWLCAESRT